MKKLIVYSLWLLVLAATGCKKDFLNRLPSDRPSDANFYSTEKELVLGVNGCYKMLPFHLGIRTDAITDLGLNRAGARTDVTAVATGAQTPLTGGLLTSTWEGAYQGIARCNSLLDNMHRAQAVTPAATFARIRAEARFLRAYYYFILVQFYGDVPLITNLQTLEESQAGNTPSAETLAFILDELTAAAADLPLKYTGTDVGRATRGAALATKAKTALWMGNWALAATTAQEVIALNTYTLYVNYRNLFTYQGESSNEVILETQYMLGNSVLALSQDIMPRIVAGLSIFTPTQALVDAYECTDGLPIEQSPLYNPATPFDNRDPRLAATIIYDGTKFGDYIFTTHPSRTTTLRVSTNTQVNNPDVTNQFATFTGYCWKKYADELDIPRIATSELNFIITRYAEVLLIYAEAKIELNQIDASVLNAINQVRARAYGVNVTNTSAYPAVTTTNQTQLRKILRRERKVEFAMEGIRIFDLKRWKLAAKALNGYVYGRPLGDFSLQGIPVVDADGFPDYSVYASKLKRQDLRSFNPARDYLWPIPQKDIDVNKNLRQNPGY